MDPIVRILLVGAGASFSTKDVETGYYEALTELGHEVALYMLDVRIKIAAEWLRFWWKKAHKSDPERVPEWQDAVYRGGIEALEMALRNRSEWVIAISAMYLHPDVIVMMRRAGLKVCILFTESPYEDIAQSKVAPLANVCFTNERTSVQVLRKANPNTYYIQHAYSPKRHNTLQGSVREAHDVVFVGSGFQERIELLNSVDWDGIGANVGLYGTWVLLPSRHRLRKYIRKGVIENSTALELYKNSKIGLNLYRSSMHYGVDAGRISGAESLNPRAYELAASKTFCLTNYRQEGNEIFGNSQPVFNGADELERGIAYYLSHKEERKNLVQEAYMRVQGHDFTTRAKQVVSTLVQGG